MHQDSCRRAVVDDLDLEPISMYLQSASVHHFENTARHENPLIVAADDLLFADELKQTLENYLFGDMSTDLQGQAARR
ncbi:uncharacterized protein LOC119630422 [Bombyx mori]|uniref:Uncharacterized protein n=1 Tax=Bombyx mori TaxID=7091 RepID=A0A8R2R9Z0_BOMMO|nr:uncharacterized protein LOC119630422 isoform X3 [Bombyx mori]